MTLLELLCDSSAVRLESKMDPFAFAKNKWLRYKGPRILDFMRPKEVSGKLPPCNLRHVYVVVLR